jgi:pimeloyl-ACP methyl ester carboxylesterase
VPGASYTEPALRARVIAFIQALGLEEAVLAGESIGAVLAMTAAAEKALGPRRVVAFNLYDYRPGVERANALAALIIRSVRAPVIGPVFAALENRPILKGILSGGFANPERLPEDFVDELSRSGARRGYAQVARAVYRALPSFVAARALYPGVTAPVTLVYGDRDWSRPDERAANLRLIGPAHSLTLPETGHFAAMENPDACAQVLL